MSKLVCLLLGFAALVATVFAMTGVSAGTCGNPCGSPCARCMPCQTCVSRPCQCAQPQPQVQYQPQVQSQPQPQVQYQHQVQYQPQVQYQQQVQTTPVVTYRDVTRTEYRLQPQTQAVPVTTCQQVTVDEGQWHKIWVPKLVTKQIQHTMYQQQTTYLQVPYQVTQRVPQVSYQQTTAMVPMVTQQPVAPGCNTFGTIGWNGYQAPTMASQVYSPYTYGTPTLATYPTPMISSLPPVYGTTPTIAMPVSQPTQLGQEIMPLDRRSAFASSDLNPVPDPKYLDRPRTSAYDEWPVDSRTASRVESRVPSRTEPVRTSSANSHFVPAPSAVNVWRTRDSRLR